MTDSNQLQHEQQASNLMVSTDGRHTQNYFNSVLQNKTVTIQGIDRWLIRITMVVMVLFLVVYGCARVRVWQEARRTQNRQRVLDQYARVMMADYDERRDRAGGGRVDQGKWQYVDKEGYGVVLGKLRQLGCPQLSPAFPSSLSPYSSPSSSPSSPSSTPSPTTPVVAGISLSQLSASLQYMTLKSQPLFQPSALSLAQHAHYQQLYKIDSYTKQLPFCIVVPSFNNQASDRYKHNLNSIVQQQYRNYHVVVIEDRSTDDTGMLIDQYVRELRLQMAENGVDIEIDVHHNERNMKTMANLHKAAMDYCKEQEIFLVVDGDDELIGRQVLRLYNALFQRTGSWFIYSNFVTSTGSIGYSRPLRQQIIRDNNYRHSQFYTSHLRAYYTKLFRLIREQDLKADDGEYLHAANDVAICVPVLEMAHTRVTYVPELLYLYNSETGYNNHYLRLAEQNRNARLVKKRKKYEALVAMGFQG